MENNYKIRFSSLKDGFHEFDFKVGNEFFESLDYSEIEKADVDVHVVLEKTTTLMQADFTINGKVEVMCDRCCDNFFIPVKGEEELIYRFGEVEFDDEKVITVFPNEIDIELQQPIYEFINLFLPAKRVHKNIKDCNQEMIEKMNDYLLTEINSSDEINNQDNENDDEIDPRWDNLKKLK